MGGSLWIMGRAPNFASTIPEGTENRARENGPLYALLKPPPLREESY
jgi:hypothetical protein